MPALAFLLTADPVARIVSGEAIQLSFLSRDGLLRGACHWAALCADPSVRNDENRVPHAANWHDGQITENLSSPSHKNIPLNMSGKSVVSIRASHPKEGRVAIVTNVAVRCGGRRGHEDERG